MTDETLAQTLPILVKYSKIRVSVVEGPDAGASRELVGDSLRVGSASDNDLVLADATASRHHCSLEPVGGGVRIRDEGSTNGIFINNMRIYDLVVSSPVQLQLGSTKLSVEPLSEVATREQTSAERFGDLLGRSSRMRELFADLARIAPTDVTLLIEGETGTGKELVADSVHRASKRASGPFIVFDCGAVAPTLVESELFGQVKGAFTEAVNRPGLFEQADGGTIFLDELGELSKELQPKLLRVLERREVRRLGAQRTTPVDVRVIAATHRNLAAEVQRGNFREDLYFRLSTAHVRVPPLRDRMDDLPLLVEHFLNRANSPQGLEQIPPPLWSMFKAHRWPGNVRELWNLVQRFLVTPERVFPAESAPGSAAGPGNLTQPPALPTAGTLPPLRVARRDASDNFERAYITTLMQKTGGNKRSASAMADVSRQMLEKLMAKHGLK
ncbi:MAG TPA: sigma 54-interacting transcriptional regulator [Polyangiaceae bacterium]|nr:sigma 54-interacting transcriptional regulator [Polyangiaceae bacterium]